MLFSPKFTISIPIASSLNTIERTRGFLEAASLSEEWIAKMQQRALILEAHYTTHIEGTHLSLDQSEELLEGREVAGTDDNDVQELLNYRTAFDFVADYVRSGGPITESLIRQIHSLLVAKVRGNSAQPGQYRTIQNYVGNSITKEVIYTPPAPYEVPLLMTEFVQWLQEEKTIPPLLVAGIAQFQLVHIHPFVDGNGGTARLLSTLYLYRSGYDFKKLFTLSEYYDRHRPDYYQALQSVRESAMDMTAWLEHFTHGLETQMREIQVKGTSAIQLDLLALKHGLSERQKLLIEQFGEREFTIGDYESLCPGIHRRSLQRDLADLIAKGLLSQLGSKRAAHYRLK